MKLKLTDRAIKSLKTPALGKRLEIVDSVQPALRLRVTDKGVMTWSISTRVSGRRCRFTIGQYPTFSLALARERASKLLPEVRDGRDPVLETRNTRQSVNAPQAITLGKGLSIYAQSVLTHRRTGPAIQQALRRDLAGLLLLPVSAITTAQLAHIIDSKAATAPIAANRLVAALKPFWRWLAIRSHCEIDIARELEKPSKEHSRDRYLSDDEIAAIWGASCGMPYPWGPFFQLALLTAQRRAEVAEMRWSEIGLAPATWIIPAKRTKTNKPHIVHLAEPSMSILSELENRRDALLEIQGGNCASDFVFTSTGKTPISGFSKAKTRLDQLANVTDWRVHDFRRSFVTHAADMGVDPTVADRVLNHVAAGFMGTVQRVYQRSELLKQRRHALDAWAAHIAKITDGSTRSDTVLSINSRS